MKDLATQGLTTEKLRVGFSFWLAVTFGFALFCALCVGLYVYKTSWGIVPAIGFLALTLSSVRFASDLAKSHFFVRRSLKQQWYQTIDDDKRQKAKDALADMDINYRLINHRREPYGPLQTIACFTNENDFVKFTLRV